MGAGKEYMDCWEGIIRTLPKEKTDEYCKRFDYPSGWMQVFPCGKIPLSRAPFADMPWRNMNRSYKVCICGPGRDCTIVQNQIITNAFS